MTRLLTLSVAAVSAALLSGCVVAPVGPPPAVVYRPAPVAVVPGPVVVQPAPVYVQPGYGRHGWRDRDGDGVPNRYDRRPDNPYRY